MISFQTVKSDNKNLNVSKVDIENKIETFKASVVELCTNVHDINKNLFPNMYFRGVQVFRALTIKERDMVGHWYDYNED